MPDTSTIAKNKTAFRFFFFLTPSPDYRARSPKKAQPTQGGAIFLSPPCGD
uniref:Uncharacterized protein n=1 Tax=Siphoviridae sp. ct9GL2 TaxID=2825368 RepID=A0A8S5PVT2_9CAUD|nr:MAG TPA: hypothetical protein [Siphoviridae sp. ct9GL2]